ncbi:MAG: hypothetical protein ACKOCX_12735 [Planctomycetota bacterium]
MHHDPVRRGLAWGLAAIVLLPMVALVTLGTGGLLAAVGDAAAATVCRWVAVPLGLLWVVAIAATTALVAVSHLGRRPDRRRGRRRRVARERREEP